MHSRITARLAQDPEPCDRTVRRNPDRVLGFDRRELRTKSADQSEVPCVVDRATDVLEGDLARICKVGGRVAPQETGASS